MNKKLAARLILDIALIVLLLCAPLCIAQPETQPTNV
jgi:hypothetical protein